MLLAQVALGALAFDAPSFVPDSTGYKVTGGKVELGFRPVSGTDAFRPLIEFDLDALTPGAGRIQIDTASASPTFEVSNATLTVVSAPRFRTTIWQTTDSFSFNVRELLNSSGQDLSKGGTPEAFEKFSAKLTVAALLLVNDDQTSTQDSYVKLQGELAADALPAVKVRVDGANYVVATSNGYSLTGAGMTLAVPSFKLGGMTVSDLGLTVDYSDASNVDNYTISGGVSLASDDQKFQTQASDAAQAGGARLTIQIAGGALTTVGGELTARFQVDKIECKVTQMSFSNDFATDSFEFKGTFILIVTPDPADPNLTDSIEAYLGYPNDVGQPGLVVKGGQVQSFDGYVKGSFTLLGATLAVTDPLTFTYDRAAGLLAVSGGVTFEAGSTNQVAITADLPLDGANSGLVIRDGKLTRLDLKVTAGFTVGGLNVGKGSQDDLEVSWSENSLGQSVYTISGQAALQNVFHASVDLGSSPEVPGIEIIDGEVQFDNLRFQLGSVPLGAFEVQDLLVAYARDTSTGVWSLDASLALAFPGGWSLSGSLAFLDGALDAISIAYAARGSDPGVELGDTGMFLTFAQIAVTNLETPGLPVTVSGTVAATFGPQETTLADPRHPGATPKQGSIIAAQGSFLANDQELSISGSVYVGAVVTSRDQPTQRPTYEGLLGQGTGTVNLDWAARVYSATLSTNLLDGTFRTQTDFTFSGGAGDYTLFIGAQAQVAVPSFIPVIGGVTLANADFILDYEDNEGTVDGFIAGWAGVAGVDVGVKYDITTGDWSLFGNQEANALHDCLTDPASCLRGNGPYEYHNSFTVPAGTTRAVLSVQWPETTGTQQLAVVLPGGTVVPQSSFQDYNITRATYPNAPRTLSVTLVGDPDNPYDPLAAGNYELQLISTAAFNGPPMFTSGYSFPAPTAAVTDMFNDQADGNLVHVTVAGDVDPEYASSLAGNLRLFIDTDSTGSDGTALPVRNVALSVTPRPAGSSGLKQQYSLTGEIDLSGLFFRPYYVYAQVSDGVNAPVQSLHSATTVTTSAPISGQIVNAVPGYAGRTVGGITVFIDVEGNGRFDPGADPYGISDGEGGYTIVDAQNRLVAGTTYGIRLVLPPGTTIAPSSQTQPTTSFTYQPNQRYGFPYALDLAAGVSGVVFNDIQKDGTYDNPPDTTVAGIQVYVDLNHSGKFEPSEPTTITTTGGHYYLYGLAPNTPYTLRVNLPPTYYQTSPLAIAGVVLNGPYQQLTGLNFGVLPYEPISGTVRGYPLDQSGVLSTVAEDLSGWQVQLSQGGQVLETTTTNSTGSYQFLVKDGTYTVSQVVQPGWRELTPFTPKLNINEAATTLSPPQNPSGSNFRPIMVAPADFDGDGNQDLVAVSAHVDSGQVYVFWGNGDGTFSGPTDLGSSNGMNVFVGDTTGSGRPDVLLWNDPNDRGQVLRFQNLGNRNFGGLTELFSVYQQFGFQINDFQADPVDATAGDLNGDGIADVVQVWNYSGSNSGHGYSVWFGGPTGGNYYQFVDSVSNPSEQGGQSAGFPNQGMVKIVDLTNDGTNDLVFAGTANNIPRTNIAIGLNDANGDGRSFTWQTQSFPTASNLDFGDIDSDGLPDMIYLEVTSTNQATVVYLHNNGDGTFDTTNPPSGSVVLPYGPNQNLNTRLVDLNGDLRPEILAFGQQNNDNSSNWLAVWTNHRQAPSYLTSPDAVFGYAVNFNGTLATSATADLNGDGLADLLVADDQNNAIYIYMNNSSVNQGVYTVAVAPGEPPTTASNFTNGQLGQLNGTAYEDVNRNGRRDAADIPLGDVLVYVDRNHNGTFDRGIDPVAATGPDGAYAFNGLPTGGYAVRLQTPSQFLPPAAGGAIAATVWPGQAAGGADFPLRRRWLAPAADVLALRGTAVTALLAQTGAASDPDLRFSLAPDAPAGASIDPRTGRFAWNAPATPGRTVITVRLQDPYNPVMSESVRFAVVVPGPQARPTTDVPVGPSFVVSAPDATTATDPRLARDRAGNTVVVWAGTGASGGGVYARRYGAEGIPRDAGTRVDTSAAGDATAPAVAVAARGSYVVAWTAGVPGLGVLGVYARRFNVAGIALGEAFLVSAPPAGSAFSPAVAADARGNFVIAWTAGGGDGQGWHVYALRYDSAGRARGAVTRLSSTAGGDQFAPTAAADARGNFTVAWAANGQPKAGLILQARAWGALAGRWGGVFRVDSGGSGSQSVPAAAMNARGDLVIAWTTTTADPRATLISAQRFSAAGVSRGGPIAVGMVASETPQHAAVAVDARGGFVVAWQTPGSSATAPGLSARRYGPAGRPRGAAFRVGPDSPVTPVSATLGLDARNRLFVAWQGADTPEGVPRIVAQRYRPSHGGAWPHGPSWFRPATPAPSSTDRGSIPAAADIGDAHRRS